eukprot:8603748-Alexandrium_andersonii.AAC.1
MPAMAREQGSAPRVAIDRVPATAFLSQLVKDMHVDAASGVSAAVGAFPRANIASATSGTSPKEKVAHGRAPGRGICVSMPY